MIYSFNELSHAQAEVLALLAEECAEVIQVVGKILRHGLESTHPKGGPVNQRLLAEEIGDVRAAVRLCQKYEILDPGDDLDGLADCKIDRVDEYLHHASVDGPS